MRHSSTIVAVTAIAIALVGFQYWNSQRTPSNAPALPPLARNLPADVHLADRAFKGRIHERFPTGTSNAAIVKELSAEGFRTDKSDADWRSASLKKSLYPCAIVWNVRWRVGAADKVTATDATYGLICP